MSKNQFILIILSFCIIFLLGEYVFGGYNDIAIKDTVTTVALSEETGDENELPQLFIVIPFVTLLLMIATGPIFYPNFWEHHYPKVALAIGSVTALYYLVVLNDSHSLLHSLAEYISFIALLGSLFVASGGIFIRETEDYTGVNFLEYKELKDAVSKYEVIKVVVVEKGKDIFDFNNHMKLTLSLEGLHKVKIEKCDQDIIFLE
jgi:hypothetical protein